MLQIWAAARDSTGNLNEYIQVLEVDTLDVLGPQFVLGTPTIEVAASASRGPQNDNVTVALDEPGLVTCIVEPCDALLTDAQCAAAVQPSALQVLAGEVVGAVSSGTVQLDAAEAIAEIELLWNQVRWVQTQPVRFLLSFVAVTRHGSPLDLFDGSFERAVYVSPFPLRVCLRCCVRHELFA